VGDPHERGQAADIDGGAVRIHSDRVVPLRAGHGHRVGRAVACRATERAGEIDVDTAQVGPAHVIDRDRVRPAESVDVDRLDVVEVHDDAAEVAGERHPAEIVGGGHDLVAAGPVEHHVVKTGSAFDDVRAVARIPDEGVVTPAEEGRISAPVSIDEVVAAATEEDLVATSADEGVIAVLAVDPRCLGRRERAIDLVDQDGVVAAPGGDIDGVECAEVERAIG